MGIIGFVIEGKAHGHKGSDRGYHGGLRQAGDKAKEDEHHQFSVNAAFSWVLAEN